jgi:hypothetical protein
MPRIMADHNVEGHLEILVDVLSAPEWNEFWQEADCDIETFERLGLVADAADDVLWRRCQEYDVVLITGNRNADAEDSLEATIRREGTMRHLPVLTISNPDELIRNREYAERAAARLLEYLHVLENLRGAGRLYLP